MSPSGAVQPVIPGFYSDPSICRHGDDYYVVTSSFEYFPGVPVLHSRDLISWRQLGNVLERPGQVAFPALDLRRVGLADPRMGEEAVATAGGPSAGIYAPTIRFHDGLFWVTVTNLNEMFRGPMIVHAEDPSGPWSDPVYATGVSGIDPDLVWDDEGVCHLTLALLHWTESPIISAPVDPFSGELRGEPRPLWRGTGGVAAEGPHLYRKDDWWYLLLAEGGTERAHSITIAKARTLEGPWESCPHNPILTRRGTASPVQNTGHGDLVELGSGEWAMVYLGVRPRGFTPGFYVNGRETFLAGIDWVDGWPVVDTDRFDVPIADHSFRDDFAGGVLEPRWIMPGRPLHEYLIWDADRLVFEAGDRRGEPRHMLAVRTRDAAWTAEVDIDVLRSGAGSLIVRVDDSHRAEVILDQEEVSTVVTIGPAERRHTFPRPMRDGMVTLFIRATSGPWSLFDGPDKLELGYESDGEFRTLESFDGRYLSTEVAGGFTGRVVGVRSIAGAVSVREFRYSTNGAPD